MAIPTILAYPLPGEAELPENTASWRPDPHRAVLLIHDMQRYFVRRLPAEIHGPMVANIAAVRRVANNAGIPVIYTAQPGAMTPQQRGLLRDIWGPGMDREPADREVVPGLAPGPGDTILTKWRYSAFHRSDLEQRMHDSDRDQLIICGVYGHVGCLMTACDAFTRDIEPFLVADAIGDFSRQDHDLALRYAARRCAVVQSTRQVIASLRTVPVAAESATSLR